MDKQKYIKDFYTWKDVLAIVHQLRQPDGCPWDREQTYESMKKCVLDEANEVIEAVDHQDYVNLREELGDLMLQVLLYSEIASERDEFNLDDVINELGQKLIRRHPHVFGEEKPAQDAKDGSMRWNRIKEQEKKLKYQEYEKLFEQGKISKELLEMHKIK